MPRRIPSIRDSHHNSRILRLCQEGRPSLRDAYNDPLDRLTNATLPTGSQTNYTYNSTVEQNVYQDQVTAGDQALRTQQKYDGLGRLTQTNSYESSSQYIATTQTYDALGRVATSTNPSRPGDNLNFTTIYLYDSLSRGKTVQMPDGSSTTTSYLGNVTTAADQVQYTRQTTTDALGRATQVLEDPGSAPHLNATTLYAYDPLGNLTGVTQGSQSRTFTFDGLGRTTAAQNPESGTVSYSSYDNVGNLLTRVDNRNITTSYTYDALNRIKTVTYNDGVTPSVSYTYGDSSGVLNGKGRLTQVANGSSVTKYTSYDALGNVLSSSQVTGNQTYNFSYSYNLAGSLSSETYPSGRTVGTCYDGANRTSAVVLGSCVAATKNYVNQVSYWPHGAPNYYALGNNLVPVTTYNSRLQPAQLWGAVNNNGNQFLYVSTLNWGTTNNNGSLQGITEQVAANGAPAPQSSLATFTQSFGYDTVNRLQTASDTGGWSRRFGYDTYGNMWVGVATGIGVSPATATSDVYSASTNQKTNESYDAAGNQLTMGGIYTLAYDAENRQISETNNIGNPAAKYVYDGQGQRVEKTVGAVTTVYVYDALGQLAAEYNNSATSSPPCLTCYITYDHLGSTRMVTDQNANVISFHDYLPFGDEVMGNTVGRSALFGPGADGVNHKFTGQYRDTETGNDFFNARYYGSALGRFTSPDPANAGADLLHPQSWNAYAFVANNPLNATDPSGMDSTGINDPVSCISDASQADCGYIPVGGTGIDVPVFGGGGGSGNGGSSGNPPTAQPPVAAPPSSPAPFPPGSFPGGETLGLPPGLSVPGPFGGTLNPFVFSLCPTASTIPCAVPPTAWETIGAVAIRYTPLVAGIAYLFGPTPITPERQWELANIQALAKQTRLTGKQMASDAPSWASDYSKELGESCADFAARILREKYGADSRAFRRGAGSEYSKIKKACERGGL